LGLNKTEKKIDLKEHKKGCRNADKKRFLEKDLKNDNGILLHHRETKHQIDFERSEDPGSRRQISKALYIHKRKRINKCWYPRIDQEEF
jgi:hypothetical protein